MNKLVNYLLLIFVATICLLFAEFVIRKTFPFSANTDERNLSYNYDSRFGWFPKKNLEKEFFGSQLINVKQNEMGFRDVNHQENDNPNIMFLGDSFVWGYDVENDEIFTSHLQKEFKNKFNIYNFGVSGYGTDQEFLLLQKYYEQIKPKVVFVIFCNNDFYNNSNNVVYHGYYKPYFSVEDGKLKVQDTPAKISGNYKMLTFDKDHPILSNSHLIKWAAKMLYRASYNFDKNHDIEDPTHEIFKEMNNFLKARGSKLVVGTIDHNPELEELLAQENIDFIDLYTPLRFSEKGSHWNAEGHKFVADKINEFLK
jgi:lysophospholipase L1-like esterase